MDPAEQIDGVVARMNRELTERLAEMRPARRRRSADPDGRTQDGRTEGEVRTSAAW